MNRSDFNAKNRSYMSQDMYPPKQGEVLTIRDCREDIKKTRDGNKSWKVLQLWWVEERPPLDLTAQNIDWLVGTFGPDDDAWIRKKIFVWHDPTMSRGLALDVPRETPDKFQALKAQIAGAQGLNTKEADPDDQIPF